MKNIEGTIKVIGVVASVIGLAASAVAHLANCYEAEQRIDRKIEAKFNEFRKEEDES